MKKINASIILVFLATISFAGLIDAARFTPYEMVLVGKEEDIRKYVDKGGDVNEVDSKNKKNPLIFAAIKKDRREIFSYLLKSGADLSASNLKGQNGIHFATIYKNPSFIHALIEGGADLHQKDYQGKSPMYYAIKKGDFEAFNILLENGFDIGTEDEALETALLGENQQIIDYLSSNENVSKLVRGELPLTSFACSLEVACIDRLYDPTIESLNKELGSMKSGEVLSEDFVKQINALEVLVESEIFKEADLGGSKRAAHERFQKRFSPKKTEYIEAQQNKFAEATPIKDLLFEIIALEESELAGLSKEEFLNGLVEFEFRNIEKYQLNDVPSFVSQNKNEARFKVYFNLWGPYGNIKDEETKSVDSQYVSGYKTVVNPAYVVAELAASNALSNYNRAVNNYNLAASSGTLNFYHTTAVNTAASSLKRARTTLSYTPQYVNKASYSSYAFTVYKFTLEKKNNFLVGVRDTRKGEGFILYQERGWELPVAIQEGMYDYDSVFSFDDFSNPARVFAWFDAPDEVEYGMIAELVSEEDITLAKYQSEKEFMNVFLEPKAPEKIDPEIKSQVAKRSGSGEVFEGLVIVWTDSGHGTGFYVKPNMLVTNAHVVGSEKTVMLENYSGERFSGKVVRADLDRDLALIEVSKTGTALELGDADSFKLGEDVLAKGHPRKYYFTVTKGIASSIQSLQISENKNNVKTILTDVAINPGNSGGPLIANKKVVGVNTFTTYRNVGDQGLNIAIHVEELKEFLK